MLQVREALLNELSDVCDLGQDLSIRASVNKAVQVLVDDVDIVHVTIVDIKLLKLLNEAVLFLLILSQEFLLKLLFPLLELLDNL